MLKVNAIFNGRKKMGDEVMREGVIMGGKVALAEKLRHDHSWDGRSLIAAPITVMEAGAIVDNYWSVLGELKDLVFGANLLWAKGSKDLKVTVKMEDLGMFDFKDGNISEWLDKEELEVSYSSGDGQEMRYEEVVEKHGEVQFSLRLLVIPTSWEPVFGLGRVLMPRRTSREGWGMTRARTWRLTSLCLSMSRCLMRWPRQVELHTQYSQERSCLLTGLGLGLSLGWIAQRKGKVPSCLALTNSRKQRFCS